MTKASDDWYFKSSVGSLSVPLDLLFLNVVRTFSISALVGAFWLIYIGLSSRPKFSGFVISGGSGRSVARKWCLKCSASFEAGTGTVADLECILNDFARANSFSTCRISVAWLISAALAE